MRNKEQKEEFFQSPITISSTQLTKVTQSGDGTLNLEEIV
jgi:hypothetical protein